MPYLKLKIVSGSEMGQNDHYSFTHLGGSIGRSEECDWTLLDSDRFVSKKHLVISYRNQQFVLTDVSSNGVIINSAGSPLGRGNEHILQTTDTLIVGKHVVQVDDMSFDVEEANSLQSHDSDGDLLGLVMGASSITDPIQEPIQEPLTHFIPPETPNLFKEPEPESGLGLGDILSAPSKSATASDFSQSNEHSNPFNISAQPSSPFSATSENKANNISVKSDDSLIPDDWELFDTAPSADTFEQPIETKITVTPPVAETSFDKNQHDNTLVQSELHQSPAEFLPGNNPPLFVEEPLQAEQNVPQAAKETQPMVKPIHQEADITHQSASAEAIANTTNDDFFTALYEKLGLSKEFKGSINREAFADDIATILLSTTQGLMSLLASRTAFKQESRLSSTLIQPRSNNPIKFSIDPVDTLEMLLVKKKKGYMSVSDSYDEAVEDIQLHQMAFMSGLQGTLNGVLAQLAPEEIEKQVNKKSSRFMGLNSNSQCWQIYQEKQPLLAKSVKENLNEVLGTYFSEAYQSQINSFKNEK